MRTRNKIGKKDIESQMIMSNDWSLQLSESAQEIFGRLPSTLIHISSYVFILIFILMALITQITIPVKEQMVFYPKESSNYIISSPIEGMITWVISNGSDIHFGDTIVSVNNYLGQEYHIVSPITGQCDYLMHRCAGQHLQKGEQILKILASIENTDSIFHCTISPDLIRETTLGQSIFQENIRIGRITFIASSPNDKGEYYIEATIDNEAKSITSEVMASSSADVRLFNLIINNLFSHNKIYAK